MKMTMTLELSEEQERALREAAARKNESPEQVVMALVVAMLKNDTPQEEAGSLSQEKFDLLVDGILRDNAELYKRLA